RRPPRPVDDDHLIWLSGEARQDHAAQLLPASILIVEIADYTIRCGADCAAKRKPPGIEPIRRNNTVASKLNPHGSCKGHPQAG
ncbi:hypothetical protein, partial [Bradyrhizobium sp. CCBAU 11361]|uniref:hypothetical protein n=1 Tax=Bradyrhizobium sp. CCBAU 11361 TaxID=1630812 RepID=UPI002304CFFC